VSRRDVGATGSRTSREPDRAGAGCGVLTIVAGLSSRNGSSSAPADSSGIGTGEIATPPLTVQLAAGKSEIRPREKRPCPSLMNTSMG